jgi:hypothetical protein
MKFKWFKKGAVRKEPKILGHNPPPTFPPPDWILDLNEELARKWRSVPKVAEKAEHE